MVKLKIVSDGTRAGTKVTTLDGQEIGLIHSINIYANADHPGVFALLLVEDVTVDMVVSGTLIGKDDIHPPDSEDSSHG